jgi:hypothetical protein
MKETREEWNARIDREINHKYRWGIAFGYGLIALGVLLSMWQTYRCCWCCR